MNFERSQHRRAMSVSLETLTMATAAGASVLPSNGSGKAKRKCYAREFKLTVVDHYGDNNCIFVAARFG